MLGAPTAGGLMPAVWFAPFAAADGLSLPHALNPTSTEATSAAARTVLVCDAVRFVMARSLSAPDGGPSGVGQGFVVAGTDSSSMSCGLARGMGCRSGTGGGRVGSGTDGFAALLGALKERSGLSYGVLAQRLHVGTSTLHRYVRGESVPP